jgi:hypothetical protein
MARSQQLCGICANGGMLGFAPCDLNWGHDGDMHANGGDGFYSRQNDDEHHRRQRERARRRGTQHKSEGRDA